MVKDLSHSIAFALPHICEQYPHPQGPLSPTNPVYVYAAVILESLGKESHVADVWFSIAERFTTEADQLVLARRLREGLLKASVLVGFPRGINGLAALKHAIKHTSPDLQSQLDQDTSLRQPLTAADRETRGKAFFSRVYAQHAERILQNMSSTSGGDLSSFAVNCVYGDLMAEDSILSAKDTGLLEFACCYASGAYPQAKGHMYGSRNLGNGRKDVEGVMALCQGIASVLGVEMQREGIEEWAFLDKLKSW